MYPEGPLGFRMDKQNKSHLSIGQFEDKRFFTLMVEKLELSTGSYKPLAFIFIFR